VGTTPEEPAEQLEPSPFARTLLQERELERAGR